MTREEATKIITIMTTADGGCGHCVSDLVHQFCAEFTTLTKPEVARIVADAAYTYLEYEEVLESLEESS